MRSLMGDQRSAFSSYKLYQKVQQTMIDALDKGEYVKKHADLSENQTDLK